MEPLTIRPLEAADLAVIFSAHTRPHGAQWLARQERGVYYVAVAELDGVPVGRVGLNFDEHIDRDTAFLWAAHVEEAWQGRGIGTALVLHVEDAARARGIAAVRLFVAKDNPRAQALYRRLGYVVCGEGHDRWSYEEGGEVVHVADECWSMEKTI